MDQVVSAPRRWVESVSQLRLPPNADERLQSLMDRNNDGELAPAEIEELEALADWSMAISVVRMEAMRVLDEQSG